MEGINMEAVIALGVVGFLATMFVIFTFPYVFGKENKLDAVAVTVTVAGTLGFLKVPAVGIIIGLCIIGICIAMIVHKRKSNLLAAEEAGKERIRQEHIKFYEECLKSGINDLESKANMDKANLIAQKNSYPIYDIKLYFEESRKLYESENSQKQEIEKRRITEQENEQRKVLEKYMNDLGRNKRIRMLTDQCALIERQIDYISNSTNTLVNSSQQKEKNWSIMGGIAEGIAGTAAGVATALDIQAQNAQIRAQNQANLDTLKPLLYNTFLQRGELRKEIEKLEKEIDNAKTKLVSEDISKDVCFASLDFSEQHIYVSSNGTCTVTAKVKMKKPIIIYDKIKAIVDGCIVAAIYDGEKVIGLANMVLPEYGVSENSTVEIKGMCVACGEDGKKYTAQFRPKNLWAMER